MNATLGLIAAGPLATALVLMQSPSLLARIPRGPKTALLGGLAGAVLFAVARAAVGAGLDPYVTILVGAATWAGLEAMRTLAPPSHGSLTGTDLALFLGLWAPFDLRFIFKILPGDDDFSYAFWALYVAVFATVAFGRMRGAPLVSVRLAPRPSDVPIVLACLLGFAAIALPVGLGSGFLTWSPPAKLSLRSVSIEGLGILLTIAIPEEIFFRGILQDGLERSTRRPWMGLALASTAFGLTHWNNADDLAQRLVYCTLATVAGLFYGAAYRRTGAVLPAAIVHASVDLIWRTALTRP